MRVSAGVPPSGVVTFLFTDIEGSTRRWEADADAMRVALAAHDEVKFVIKDRVDYDFARDVIARHNLAGRAAAVLFSPVHGVLDAKPLATL